MQEEDIPLLTEVHAFSGQVVKSLGMNADLIAEILAQIKPLLEDDIEKTVTQRLEKKMQNDLEREIASIQKLNQTFLADLLKQQAEQLEQKLGEIYQQAAASAKQAVMENNATFFDKTRADLATEIPKMMHANAEVIKADLAHILNQMQAQSIADVQANFTNTMPMLKQSLVEQLQTTLRELETQAVENTTQRLQDKITRLHEDLLAAHQVSLARESTTVYQGLTEHTQAELNVYLEALQLKSKQQLVTEVDEAFPALYQRVAEELNTTLKQDLANIAEVSKLDFKLSLDAELPAVEQVLENKVHEILSTEVPQIEQKLSSNIKTEIEKLLDSVRLTFNQ